MARTDPQTNIRMPAALKETLQEAADKHGRTFGAECIYRLQRSLQLENPANVKRELAIKELRDAASIAVQLWDYDERDQTQEGVLKDAMDDLGLWLRQLEKFEDLQEAFGILQKAAEANRKG